ncbi:isopeptide-forming domain-containing fimbrial protein [Konateibacter massiliensis]|uniref:isopeptide-forming domain-containing fimbrial protein n=1 Tax=Konateibacter massiliensis TaxID=2002841 RepID=UPI000C14BC40|nr:isopeptide-forming domain-containing fimbrial protein [Konateibacter massiliensis]
MPLLTNVGRAEAMFGAELMFDTSTAEVEIPSIKVDKVADMTVWHGDVLSYTVTVTNLDAVVIAEDVVFTDTIDPTLAKLDVDSVYVDGVQLTLGTDFTYNTTTGELEITAMPDIPVGDSYDVTFRVTKA